MPVKKQATKEHYTKTLLHGVQIELAIFSKLSWKS